MNTPTTPTTIQNIRLYLIQPSVLNPRKTIEKDALRELADNIARQGLLQPITVRPVDYDVIDHNGNAHGVEYEIVCGERRYRAWSPPALDAHRARYRQFKADHWDNEHNHLHVDTLEEFYQLFREGVALRQRKQQESEPSPILERKPLKPERKQPKIEQIQLSFHFDE